MATKQTTRLCYQVNGGTCRNKVSAKNYYICAAGHKTIENTGTDGAAIQLPAEAVAKMDKYAQRRLAMNPMIGADVAQALFDTEDERIRHNLATNPSIDREMMQALFASRSKNIWSGLAENPSIDRDMTQALFDTGNEWIRCNLATNPSIDRAMMQALFDAGDREIKLNLATNPSIDREMAITLAKDGHAPIGYLENKSITELCNGENISLLNEYPQKFGQAYLNHLLGSDEDLDQMKALLCYSYDCYRKADGYNPEHYKGLILDKYPGDEEIKILLS